VRWFNTYGPTEATVIATVFEPAAEGFDPDAGRELPIGRPIPNCPVYVLDRFGAPVPIGVRGELHIGGEGVALGYLHEPDLTAQRFVPNTVDHNGGRLYRTGDVVRWLPDGTLAFVGRVDHQVKIRGFRVEPAEVAGVIARHPAVGEVAVVARRDGPDGAARLVGYVTCAERADAPPTGKELRRFAAEILPAYMTPSAIVVVDALPRTPNGKVDHDALPDPPAADDPGTGGEPRDAIERELLALWRELLGRDVGIFDDFFDAGGHSLLAVRMFGRIERDFGRRLPLAALITAPTVAELADVLRDDTPVGDQQLVTLREGTDDVPIFFVHGPMGEAIIYLELARRLEGGHAVHAFQDRGLDGSLPQYASIPAMATAYVEEIQRRQPAGPYVLGGFCMGGVVAYEMANQLRQRGERVATVLLIDAAPLGHLAGGRVYTTRGRIRTHLQEFSQLRGRALADHVWETTTNVYDRMMRPTWWRFVRARYLDRGRPLPRFFQDVEAVNWRLATDYVAPAYTGRVALLRELHGSEPAGDRYRREMWASLVAGGEFTVHDVRSEAVTHMTLLKEPHVRLLAREMDAAVAASLAAERAQQA
jgi:thioesterase domain-containing protein